MPNWPSRREEHRQVFAGASDIPIHFETGLTTIELTGELDLAAHDELEAVCALAIDFAAPVKVDVSGVSFMDSTGVAFLAQLVGAGYAYGWRPVVVGANRRVREAIELAGLHHSLDLAEPSP